MRKKFNIFDRFLNITETVGNALPNPATLFALFACLFFFFPALHGISIGLPFIPVQGKLLTL